MTKILKAVEKNKDESNILDNFTLLKPVKIPEPVLLSFNNLEEDKFIKNSFKYRLRRYSIGALRENKFGWLNKPSNNFYQTKSHNMFVGGVKRKYSPINRFVENYLKNNLINHMLKFLPQSNYEIGAHQIRIQSEEGRIGYPAPEGVHQDGFDFICIVMAQRNNLIGGTTILSHDGTGKKILYEGELNQGQMLLINDRKVFHYTKPVSSLDDKIVGTRDVFVITFKRI